MTENSLLQHFKWWDDFINRWLHGEGPEQDYLPEPWWGWSPYTGHPLYSVCLNLGAGEGGASQSRDAMIATLDGKSYNTAMTDGTLAIQLGPTHGWHTARRAIPILAKQGVYNNYRFYRNNPIFHHLSIELTPFHAEKSDKLESLLKKNPELVRKHIIPFAAKAAQKAEGPLNNIVVVRCGASRFRRLAEICGFEVESLSGNGEKPAYPAYFRLTNKTTDLGDVRFVCVSDVRNDIPVNQIEIIIINQLNKLSK